VHGLDSTSLDGAVAAPGAAHIFSRQLFSKAMIVPSKYRWYFVRPGVRQLVTHQVILENPGPLVEITAGFTYHSRSEWPHTARRVFEVEPATPVGPRTRTAIL